SALGQPPAAVAMGSLAFPAQYSRSQPFTDGQVTDEGGTAAPGGRSDHRDAETPDLFTSTAPMSHAVPCGRCISRWSCCGHAALSPASIAGMSGKRLCVC